MVWRSKQEGNHARLSITTSIMLYIILNQIKILVTVRANMVRNKSLLAVTLSGLPKSNQCFDSSHRYRNCTNTNKANIKIQHIGKGRLFIWFYQEKENVNVYILNVLVTLIFKTHYTKMHGRGSNPRPPAHGANALTTEPPLRKLYLIF